MKNHILTLCSMLLALCAPVRAQQWIIDGQQTQVLKLEVSDPQALYTDGSREMTAPLSFAPSLTATGGMFRAYYAPEGRTEEFFIINGADEYVQLSSGCGTFRVGDTFVHGGGLYSGLNSAAISFDEKLLSGGWMVEDVPDNTSALMSRGYADSRYVMNGQDAVEFGADTVASGDYAAAFGYKNHASGKYSVAFNGAIDPEEPEEGIYTNVASGMGSAVFGWGNVASGNGSVAFGWESVASGNWSLAAGSSDAIGEFSTALGEVCAASGPDSFAAGYNTSATGDKSVALGHSTTASAQGSFANGFASSASGNYSTAWGSYCQASGPNSIAFGTRAKALHPGAVVITDSQNADVTSATNDTLTVRAQNGVYLQADAIHSSGPLVFDSTLTATNGALQIYATDSDDHLGYFKSLSFQDGLQFSTMHSASLFFGMNSNDGLLIGPDSIMQFGYNARIEFETGTLKGVSGAKQWHVSEDPTEASGIVNRGYADSRYLRSDIDLTAPLTFALGSGTPTNPVIRMHIPVMGSGLRDCFYFDENDEGIRLCDEPVALLIDELRVESENISLGSKQIGMDTGRFYGDWETMSVPDSNFAIMNRSYTDTRYLKRTEGITTNRVIQAGDTLVISNGLITAINP